MDGATRVTSDRHQREQLQRRSSRRLNGQRALVWRLVRFDGLRSRGAARASKAPLMRDNRQKFLQRAELANTLLASDDKSPVWGASEPR